MGQSRTAYLARMKRLLYPDELPWRLDIAVNLRNQMRIHLNNTVDENSANR